MYLPVKRFFDLLFSFIGLILLSPLLIPVMIILKCTGEHEVFFLQKRIGYRNREFSIWKFATMVKDSPLKGTGEITLRNDPRVTPAGRFLRKTKINELPQVLNVLGGSMSLVGPRPLMKKSFDLYSEEVKKVVYNTHPGMTGIGSVIFRDEEKIISQSQDIQAAYHAVFQHKGEVEMWYQKNISFYTDLVILFLTGWYIFFPHSRLAYKVFPSLPRHQF